LRALLSLGYSPDARFQITNGLFLIAIDPIATSVRTRGERATAAHQLINNTKGGGGERRE
jgi:hypothetical protein